MPRKRVDLSVPDGQFGEPLLVSVSPPDKVWIRLECYQDDALVYAQYQETVDGVAEFMLGPTPSWNGGAAEGEATALLWRKGGRGFRVLDTEEFDVSA